LLAVRVVVAVLVVLLSLDSLMAQVAVAQAETHMQLFQ
jgi:hypothetical protein